MYKQGATLIRYTTGIYSLERKGNLNAKSKYKVYKNLMIVRNTRVYSVHFSSSVFVSHFQTI